VLGDAQESRGTLPVKVLQELVQVQLMNCSSGMDAW
jgi:hypothetical protein